MSGIVASKYTCIGCKPGKYQNRLGASTCLGCPRGYSQQQNDSSFCLPCNAGRYSTHSSSHRCQPCPPGRFQPSINATTCLPCHKDTYSNVHGASTCISCPLRMVTAGKEADDPSLCICQRGYIQKGNGSARECRECPRGAACTLGVASSVQGFWKANVFIECEETIDKALSACLANDTCFVGNRGPLCAACCAWIFQAYWSVSMREMF